MGKFIHLFSYQHWNIQSVTGVITYIYDSVATLAHTHTQGSLYDDSYQSLRFEVNRLSLSKVRTGLILTRFREGQVNQLILELFAKLQ